MTDDGGGREREGMYLNAQRGAMWTLALGLGVVGCDKGSVGEYESDDGGSSSGSVTTGVSTSATASGSGGSSETGVSTATASDTSASGSASSSATEGADTGVLLDVGTGLACEGNEHHQCAEAIDCGDSCGDLDSMFDAEGCVRQPCGLHSDCGADEFCYQPLSYGGCQSSDVGCTEDVDGNCQCASLPDCGGSYCVPTDIVFGGAQPGPTEGFATDDCGPDDGPAFTLQVGTYISDACGGQFDEEPRIQFLVAQPLGTTGTYVYEGPEYINATYYPDGLTPQPVQWAVLRIPQWDGTLSGEYEVTLEDETVLFGEFFGVSCAAEPPPMCG